MPRILVAGALLWPNVGRLCRAFRDVGFDVCALAVAEHPVHQTRAPTRTFPYRPKAPLASVRQAIAKLRPDLIVPCDDRIAAHLRALWALKDGDVSALIETSLGGAASEDLVGTRGTLGELARLPHVTVPRTDTIASVAELADWAKGYGLPAVLKLDGSWGGRDVVLVRDEGEVERAFLRMRLRRSFARRLKRYLLERDVEALDFGRTSAISVQAYVAGRAANLAIACWKGEIVGHVAVEVVKSLGPFGNATVIRVVDGEAMVAAARSVAAHYQLSGVHGLDFVVVEGAQRPFLVEINPRATQTGHLPLGLGRDLAAGLFSAVDHERAVAFRPPLTCREITLFPQEWRRDRQSSYLSSAFHDIPADDMELARFYGFEARVARPG